MHHIVDVLSGSRLTPIGYDAGGEMGLGLKRCQRWIGTAGQPELGLAVEDDLAFDATAEDAGMGNGRGRKR